MNNLIKYFIFICFFLSVNAYSQSSCILNKSVHYNGNENDKKNAITIVDQSLKAYGNLGYNKNLSSGVRALVQNSNEIKIIDAGHDYHVLIYPKNGQSGRDFSLYINKETLLIKNTVIANLIPIALEDDFDD